jgi:dihydroneopterin aldolase
MRSALDEFLSTQCRRIFLRRYSVDVRIGVRDTEKRGAQRVCFSVDLHVLLSASTPRADQLSEVLDYDLIRATIAERVGRGHIHLLETLCDDTAELLLANPKIHAVRVSAEKPDAYPDSESIGVEVFRSKPLP